MRLIDYVANGFDTYTISADLTLTSTGTDNPSRVRNVASIPTISANERWIAYGLTTAAGGDLGLRPLVDGVMGTEIIAGGIDWAQGVACVEFARHTDSLLFVAGASSPNNYTAVYSVSRAGDLELLSDIGSSVTLVQHCSWNDDGSKLAVYRAGFSGSPAGVRILGFDGGNLSQLATADIVGPRLAFVPNRTDIVIMVVGTEIRMYDVSANTFNLTGQVTDATAPFNVDPDRIQFSPNGVYALIGRNVLDVTGSAPAVVATLPASEIGYAWLSDSKILSEDDTLATEVANVFHFDGSSLTLFATSDFELSGTREGVAVLGAPLSGDDETRIIIRHDLPAVWVSSNILLRKGELGIEESTNKLKIGDGVTPWNSLPYYDENFLQLVDAPASASASGEAGQVAYDSGFIYICVDTDTWVRAAIATW